MSPTKFIDQTIYLIFFALALVTPLIFTTQTTELYEVPKMFFVYFSATSVLFLTIVNFLLQKKLTIPKNKTFLAFLFLTFILLVSTLFSVDKFTSIFGYPTRLNGGLLSQFAYLALFFCALVNLDREKAQKILMAIVIGATAVSLWGIPSHFGKDPTCLLLKGELTSDCWQKEFNPTLRIFSTLGQPNWLASYLVLTIPLSLSLLLMFKEQKSKIFFSTAAQLQFFALILTNSRSGILGFGFTLFIWLALIGPKNLKINKSFLTPLLVVSLVIIFFFGSFITSRITQFLPSKNEPAQTTMESPAAPNPSIPTESGEIRLIVWKGAVEIFKSSPILGTGPETFVSSYYKFRPREHNQTSEWEFFYNKAHNEFLNYLANSGAVGLLSFCAFIIFTLVELLSEKSLFAKAAIASGVGYFTTIFFGFSIVPTQIVFLLILSCVFYSKEKILISISAVKSKPILFSSLAVAGILFLFTLTFFLRLYLANFYLKKAQATPTPSRELLFYRNAITTSPQKNPYIMSDFSFAIAGYLDQVEKEENKKILIDEATENAKEAINLSPNNYLVVQKVTKTYTKIVNIDQSKADEARSISSSLTTLAPTYPGAYLTLAQLDLVLEDKPKAIKNLEKALDLKPDYLEAKQLESELTIGN